MTIKLQISEIRSLVNEALTSSIADQKFDLIETALRSLQEADTLDFDVELGDVIKKLLLIRKRALSVRRAARHTKL